MLRLQSWGSSPPVVIGQGLDFDIEDGQVMVTSEYIFPTVLLRSTTAAKDEVMTTRLTEGALFLIALSIPVVPMIARCILSDTAPNSEFPAQGYDTWIKQFLLHVGSIEVVRAGRMNDGPKRWVRNDSLVKC